MKILNVSSLEKHYTGHEVYAPAAEKITLCPGEVYHFMQHISTENFCLAKVELHGELAPYAEAFLVCDMPADMPTYSFVEDSDYLFREPGPVSDLLVPLSEQKELISIRQNDVLVWFDLAIPADMPAGRYSFYTTYRPITALPEGPESFDSPAIEVTVSQQPLPEQKLIETQWFHVDCIAQAYQLPVYSEEHWQKIGQFMRIASKHGQNMILTPVITPPLDTEIGSYRPNTQLVRITKNGEAYTYDWSLLDRYIDLAHESGIRYFEISHLFSQWGLKAAPAIYATVDGQLQRIFGWDHASDDPAYLAFLSDFLPKLVAFLREKGVIDACFFHLSDEPSQAALENYRKFHDFVVPLLGRVRMMDALSDLAFYQEGLVETPVTASNHIEPFLTQKIEHQWVYYCCGQAENTSNRFLAMPGYRTRSMGLSMYLYDIEGFLQWGFNYYNCCRSIYAINPFATTSGDQAYPSGDPFTVYPGQNGPLPSVRQKVFLEGLQDLRLCQLVEQKIGKEAVKALIQKAAVEDCGEEITFSSFPRNIAFYEKLNAQLKALL